MRDRWMMRARRSGRRALLLATAASGAAALHGLARPAQAAPVEAKAGAPPAAAFQSRQAVPASDVDRLLGINADFTQGNWTRLSGPGSLLEQSRFIGAETIRTGLPEPGHWTETHWPELLAAGLQLDLVVNPTATPEANQASVKAMLLDHPGRVRMVEGPNEPNNWGVTYAGKSGVEGAIAWQKDFYAAMKADPVTRQLPVYGMSSFPLIASASDVNNLHVYPFHAEQAGDYIADARKAQEAIDPGKLWGITEFGYFTLPGVEHPAASQWLGVDEAAQARLLLNAYMDAALMGARHLSLYALRDWRTPQPDDCGAHFGLFRGDDTPKPAAVALHHLQAILDDPNPPATAPGRLDYATTGSADMRSLLMQHSDGRFILAFWRRAELWDRDAKRYRAAPAEGLTVQFAAAFDGIRVLDPMVGAEPTQVLRNASEVRLAVADSPIFVVLGRPRGDGAARPATQRP